MRRRAVLTLLPLAVACGESPLVEPAVAPELSPVVAAAPSHRIQYEVQFFADFECTSCDPFEARLTPSMLIHFSNGTNGFFVTGELEGYALISGGTNSGHFNLRDGKGIGSGTLHVDLTKPGVGAFDCHWHASWEGYMPPDWLYVEYGKWFNCKGSGDFEGKQMVLWNDNAETPGWPYNKGIAEIW